MPAEVKTIDDLKTVLVGLTEGIKIWTQTFPFQELTIRSDDKTTIASNNEEEELIKSSKLESPLTEITKLSKLLKAHTTKIGIVYKPPISKNNYFAAYNTTRELSSCVVLLISVLHQIISDGSKGFYTIKLQSELKRKSLNLLSNISVLFNDLLEIVEHNEQIGEDEDKAQPEEFGSNRLITIGKIWDSGDKLIEISEGGNTGSIKIELDSCNSIIKDAKAEFEEWLEDPEIEDDDDPFGLDDKFSDDETESDNDNDKDNDESDKEENDKTCFVDGSDTKIKPSYLKSAENWLQKLKLIYFLISNIKSYLPLNSSLESSILNEESRLQKVKTLNSISKLSVKLPEIIDEAIDELTQGYYTEDINSRLLKDLNETSQKLISGLKVLNKENKAKLEKIDEFYAKWCKLVKDLN